MSKHFDVGYVATQIEHLVRSMVIRMRITPSNSLGDTAMPSLYSTSCKDRQSREIIGHKANTVGLDHDIGEQWLPVKIYEGLSSVRSMCKRD
jgi:hypothetical protein